MGVQETAATEEIADRIQSALTSRDPRSLEPLLADDARWGSCVGRNQVIEYMSGVSLSTDQEAAGAVVGGQLGATVGRRLSPVVLRAAIVIVGLAASIKLFVDAF